MELNLNNFDYPDIDAFLFVLLCTPDVVRHTQEMYTIYFPLVKSTISQVIYTSRISINCTTLNLIVN